MMMLTKEKLLCLSMVFVIVASNKTNQDNNDKRLDFDLGKDIKKNLPFVNESRYLKISDSNLMNSQQKKFIRVTVDKRALKPSVNQDTDQAIEALVSFIQKFIKVIPLKKNNKMIEKYCPDFIVPPNDIKKGIENSDLHLYFKSFSEEQIPNKFAQTGLCQMSQEANIKVRPSFGVVELNWDKYNQESGTHGFKIKAETLIHEVIHLLGFRQENFHEIYNSNGNVIGRKNVIIKKNKKSFLSSPYVLQTARKYFKSNTLIGVPLDGVEDHWYPSVFLTEIMAEESIDEGSSLSIFTHAVLSDSGFWEEVNENLTNPYFWGKGQGKEFVENTCKQSNIFEEYQNQTEGCNFSYNAKFYPQLFSTGDDSTCQYMETDLNTICKNSEINIDLNGSYLENSKYQNKCLNSEIDLSILSSGKENNLSHCLLSQCLHLDNGEQVIQITIPQIQKQPIVTCYQNESKKLKNIKVGQTKYGVLSCPSNYERFCGLKSCINDCSKHGICIRGTCHCNSGWAGHSCKIPCKKGVDYNRKCIHEKCPDDTFANPDNTCKRSCPTGYYKEEKSKRCELCDFSCSECSGPKPNQCTACQFLTYLVGSSCSRCPVGKYPKSSDITKPCVNCPINCKSCLSENECLKCLSGYQLSKGKCINLSVGVGKTNQQLKQQTQQQPQAPQTNRKRCKQGQYQSLMFFCKPCIEGCLQCKNSNSCDQESCNTSSGFHPYKRKKQVVCIKSST